NRDLPPIPTRRSSDLEKEQAEQAALSLRKTDALRKAGYSDEQSQLLVKLIEGDDDEAIAESIEQIKATVPITDNYADPSTFNGRSEEHTSELQSRFDL